MTREYRLRLLKFALESTPANVRVIEVIKSLEGTAYCDPKYPEFGKMCVPKPATRKTLYVFLHECAHFELHANGKRKKEYIKEMEAERWAHAKMRAFGIPVPKEMTRSAKSYVRRHIREELAQGVKKFDAEAIKYTNPKLNQDGALVRLKRRQWKPRSHGQKIIDER
jgi:hypothetical protein